MLLNKLILFYVIYILKLASSSDSYRTLNLESDRVCAHSPKFISKRISTGSDGVIVKETSYFDNWSGKYSFSCRFEVETGHKSQFPGLFMVIQKLHLRKDPNTGQCLDYIKVRPVDKDVISEISYINFNLKKNSFSWHFFCGDLRARRDGTQVDVKQEDPDGIAVTGFLSDDVHVVEVEVFISKIPVVNETLELEIAFTPFTRCKNSWSEYKDCGSSRCIKKQSFNDGVVNCPFLDCPDEDGCGINLIDKGSLQRSLSASSALSPPEKSTMPEVNKQIDPAIIKNAVQSHLSNEAVLKELVARFTAEIKTVVEEAIQAAVKPLTDEISRLQDEVFDLRTKLRVVDNNFADRMDEIEQYQRRSNLRIFGISETPAEDTDALVVQLCKEKLHIELPVDAICRSHRVGKQPQSGPDGTKRPRPIKN